MFWVAFGATLLFTFVLQRIPWLQHRYTRAEPGRDSKNIRSFRLGGLAIAGGFFVALLLDERLVWDKYLLILSLGAVIALGFGLWDDFRPLHWSYQLLGQLLLGTLLFVAGMTLQSIHLGGGLIIDFSHPSLRGVVFLITVGWMILVMNALNWVDGVDGLLGSVMSIALITLFILSLRPEVNQPAMALLTIMLFGALLAFLAFNWFPARIMAGSGGAFFLGFMLAAFSLYAGAKVATALMVLVLPILDALSVILHRFRQGKSLFLPDKQHLHHLLLSLGWSPRKIVCVYSGVTLVLASLALSVRALEKVWVLIVGVVLFFVAVICIQAILLRKQ